MDLQIHLKNFTGKELRQEVLNVKRDFAVSQLKRADVERVILANSMFFQHLLRKKETKKRTAIKKKTIVTTASPVAAKKKTIATIAPPVAAVTPELNTSYQRKSKNH